MTEENLLTEKLARLPEDIKKSISSVDLPVKLAEIVKRNGLMIDQAGALETETSLVMIGIAPLKNYVDNLARELQIPREKAVIIAHDVDELIFKNIRASLKKMNYEMFTEEGVSEKMAGESEPNREEILNGIENPSTISGKENSVSVSSLKSNSLNPEYPLERFSDGVEVKKVSSMELEIPREAMLPAKSPSALLAEKPAEPYHQNISPVNNIVEQKLANIVSVPKEKIAVTETSKLPQKPAEKHDPYREPLA